MDPIVVHDLLEYLVPGTIILAIVVPGVRLVTKWLEPRTAPSCSELAAIDARLAKIETAVYAIALEVERVSESRRFVAKLEAARLDRPRPVVARRDDRRWPAAGRLQAPFRLPTSGFRLPLRTSRQS